jgi:hypothetical protein
VKLWKIVIFEDSKIQRFKDSKFKDLPADRRKAGSKIWGDTHQKP